uniref:NADH-ubiquinone oxidoreductase chain 2 n=1 Tax=Cucujus mniszechi TaxID=433034 RepID=A0A7G7MUE8_9CUCU|nr:NADH dehydrogenase subunit 2 [Cucujus mniszechi]QNG56457.1 NADH dehydrogenase subunit 2 [Cucujus mniszechi]
MKMYKILFLNSMIMGTLITISAYSWMSMWMGLEINLLSIIPLLNKHKNIYPSESAMKYFITQTMASSIILFSVIMMSNKFEFIPQNLNFSLLLMMNSAILTKMGAAPFHFWFPEVMEGLNWFNCFLILTWQKIAPMIIYMYNCNMMNFTSWIIIISSVIGSIMGFNQISLRKILTYSSINHISWMLASMLNSQIIWLIYFLIYSIISFNIIIIFHKWNIFYINQLINIMNYNMMIKLTFNLNFLSLGGLPPFLGFLPKWMTIHNLISNNFFLLSLIMIIFTLLTLFYYLRITFSSILILNKEYTKNFSIHMNNFIILFSNIISLSGLLVCTQIFSFY